MNFTEIAQNRQSCRSYDPAKPVEREKLDAILESARLAPSACNGQPYHITICRDENAQAVAKACMGMGLNKFATDAPILLVISEEPYCKTAALGAKVTISDRPGYFPRLPSKELLELTKEALEGALESVSYKPDGWGTGCSDIGDVSSVMPAVHPYIGGVSGKSHGADYCVDDPEAACQDIAKTLALMLELLLKDDAKRCREIVEAYEPRFPSVQAYLEYAEALILDREAVKYDGKGNVLLNLGAEEMSI